MKTTKSILLTSLLASALFFTVGCADDYYTAGSGHRRNTRGESGGVVESGIDPVTMAGIEQSNRNTDDEIQRVNEEANAQAAASVAGQ